VFEKIISKNAGDDSSSFASSHRSDSPTPLPATRADLSDASRPVAISAGQRNVLLPDVEIEGEVRFENDLIVDGKIEGKITSDGSLTIGEPARIKAEINCGSVVVHGRVQGNINVKDRVEIRAKAEVIGDIKAASLVMEAGAIFVGASTIGTPKQRPAEAKAPADTKAAAETKAAVEGKAPATKAPEARPAGSPPAAPVTGKNLPATPPAKSAVAAAS
jgi:cytoskeletal protein CcmA (bactofilin family)